MNEFGSESRADREDCLKGCLDVKLNYFLKNRLVMLNKVKHGFMNYNMLRTIEKISLNL
jgi:hypothetical protein